MSDDYDPSVDREFKELLERVSKLQDQVEDQQFQIFRLGIALVQSLTYSAHIALQFSASNEESRKKSAARSDELLRLIDENLQELPWAESERPKIV